MKPHANQYRTRIDERIAKIPSLRRKRIPDMEIARMRREDEEMEERTPVREDHKERRRR